MSSLNSLTSSRLFLPTSSLNSLTDRHLFLFLSQQPDWHLFLVLSQSTNRHLFLNSSQWPSRHLFLVPSWRSTQNLLLSHSWLFPSTSSLNSLTPVSHSHQPQAWTFWSPVPTPANATSKLPSTQSTISADVQPEPQLTARPIPVPPELQQSPVPVLQQLPVLCSFRLAQLPTSCHVIFLSNANLINKLFIFEPYASRPVYSGHLPVYVVNLINELIIKSAQYTIPITTPVWYVTNKLELKLDLPEAVLF